MCFNIGALVLAEGVEDGEEILRSLKLDIDLFQGFWFARPSGVVYDKTLLNDKIAYIGAKHTHNVRASMQHKEFLMKVQKRIHIRSLRQLKQPIKRIYLIL